MKYRFPIAAIVRNWNPVCLGHPFDDQLAIFPLKADHAPFQLVPQIGTARGIVLAARNPIADTLHHENIVPIHNGGHIMHQEIAAFIGANLISQQVVLEFFVDFFQLLAGNVHSAGMLRVLAPLGPILRRQHRGQK